MKVLIVDASMGVQQYYAEELKSFGIITFQALDVEQAKKKLKKKRDIEAVVCGEMLTPLEQLILLDIIRANQERFPDTMISTAEVHSDMLAQVFAGCTAALERNKVSKFLQLKTKQSRGLQ